MRALVQAEKAKLMKAIEKGGVRLQRTGSTLFDPKMQGDMAMLAPAMIRKRQELKKNAHLDRTIRSWWDSMNLGGTENNLEKDSYIQINMAMHFMLVPDVMEYEARKTAEADWAEDLETHEAPGATTMSYSSFYDAMVSTL
jgi:hypothetical protein